MGGLLSSESTPKETPKPSNKRSASHFVESSSVYHPNVYRPTTAATTTRATSGTTYSADPTVTTRPIPGVAIRPGLTSTTSRPAGTTSRPATGFTSSQDARVTSTTSKPAVTLPTTVLTPTRVYTPVVYTPKPPTARQKPASSYHNPYEYISEDDFSDDESATNTGRGFATNTSGGWERAAPKPKPQAMAKAPAAKKDYGREGCNCGGDFVECRLNNHSRVPTRRPSPPIEDAFSRMNLYDSSRLQNPPKQRFTDDEDAFLNGAAFASLSLEEAKEESGIPIYTLTVTPQRVCIFQPGREKFIEVPRSAVPSSLGIKADEIYLASSFEQGRVNGWLNPTEMLRKHYIDRAWFTYGSKESYRRLVLPALLLGSRVRDYEQRCAVVDKIGDLVLNMPGQNRRLQTLKLKTSSGEQFEIDVKHVIKKDEEDKRWTVVCKPPKPDQPLPLDVTKGCLLELMDINGQQPRVTFALMQKYANPKSPIENWNLLSCIYGACAKKDYPAVAPINPFIHLAKNAGSVQLNPEQIEAVSRYNCTTCPAFVVESPPGSGKTMTAAAMAISYTGTGVQMFLSTANVPVINMALALSKLDYGTRKAIHLISSEREELMTDETRSPFTVLSLAKANAKLVEKIEALEAQLKHAPNLEEEKKLQGAIRNACCPVFADKFDIYFATVDTILGRLTKKENKNDLIKKQLMNDVRRVVVDEASQLTEAALNALILSFPKAQIVLIGDSKQLPPFRYAKGEVVSELAARSALEVIKDKMNLPVTKLNRVYRASPTLMAHYSDVFYDGSLKSGKPETYKNPLACFGARSKGYRALFWQVKGYQKQSGTSKINDGEIACLKYLINILRSSSFTEKDVMIISYYEAQRKKVEEELQAKGLDGYEVLTVDSAQGREKKIVIVMTTRTSVPTEQGAFFSCPLRCNVAVSRHQEAIIVLGHAAIAAAPNWSRVLNQKYFRHVPPYKG